MEKDGLEVQRQLEAQIKATEAAYRARDTTARHLARVQAEANTAQGLLKKLERAALSRAKAGRSTQTLTSEGAPKWTSKYCTVMRVVLQDMVFAFWRDRSSSL